MLSVAGLLVIPALFPVWSRFIPEVFLKRPEWEDLTFRERQNGAHSYVTEYQECARLVGTGGQEWEASPTVKRVGGKQKHRPTVKRVMVGTLAQQ